LGIDKIPHVIFHGPPGTGKTMFASAVAGEAGIPFVATSGSDLRAKYYGESTERIGEIFKKARDLSVRSGKKVVLFIDEIDSLGQNRNSVTGNDSQDYRASLNKLLTEVDGSQQKVSSDPQGEVFIIGATNSLEILDPALLRPGRFNRQIFMGLPTESDRKIILDKYKQYPLAPNVDLDVIAQNTDGFSGAALSNLLLESAFRAARNDQDTISLENVNEALARYKESKATKSDGSSKSDESEGSTNFDKLFSKESIGQVKEFLSNLFKKQNNNSDTGDLDFDDISEDGDVD
jgi:cell division protease FtsH